MPSSCCCCDGPSTWHRYDAFFLRTGAFDVPAEGKSAFAQEMEDVAVMASECTDRSLVMLDEIGRGTASREGAALATALVGWLDGRGMSAVVVMAAAVFVGAPGSTCCCAARLVMS